MARVLYICTWFVVSVLERRRAQKEPVHLQNMVRCNSTVHTLERPLHRASPIQKCKNMVLVCRRLVECFSHNHCSLRDVEFFFCGGKVTRVIRTCFASVFDDSNNGNQKEAVLRTLVVLQQDHIKSRLKSHERPTHGLAVAYGSPSRASFIYSRSTFRRCGGLRQARRGQRLPRRQVQMKL